VEQGCIGRGEAEEESSTEPEEGRARDGEERVTLHALERNLQLMQGLYERLPPALRDEVDDTTLTRCPRSARPPPARARAGTRGERAAGRGAAGTSRFRSKNSGRCAGPADAPPRCPTPPRSHGEARATCGASLLSGRASCPPESGGGGRRTRPAPCRACTIAFIILRLPALTLSCTYASALHSCPRSAVAPTARPASLPERGDAPSLLANRARALGAIREPLEPLITRAASRAASGDGR